MAEGEIKSFNDILTEYENMIYYLIMKLGIRDSEKEFYQEGMIALWEAVESYNAKRGKFSSYAYFRIEKAMLSLIRKRNRQKENEQAYISQVKAQQGNTAAFLEEGLDPYLHARIAQVLTDKQMKWFTSFVLEDLSLRTISEQEQVTIDAVKNWARNAKPKIQPLLRDDGSSKKKRVNRR
ncbi:sigma-70 family RNA polymerase sigma factor [Sediminibacillus albus]|uniref:RNA polymerase sigma factor, sigma-70 family n=1 Tax=Sediminibacillus albus TaxID=407036 RepID=A0A1G8Y4U4_9BACI|nr:sigma-70 family RNA polymerase sigma factor [Sediminibacillus albus]SDJ97801.1 RNA polymerase sigma factor, sigma-70 family [Sediminibacillus albus]